MKTRIYDVLIYFTLCLILLFYFGYQYKQNVSKKKFISTMGQAVRSVVSDSVKWTIEIVNETDILKDIQDKRKSDIEEVDKFLKKEGINESEIHRELCTVEDALRYSSENMGKKKNIRL